MKYYLYRVNRNKSFRYRKWQGEWDGCQFAQRGYTKLGVRVFIKIRRSSLFVDNVYVRFRIIIRRNITQRTWYHSRYTWSGVSRLDRDTNEL